MIISFIWIANALFVAIAAYNFSVICAEPKYIFEGYIDILERIRDAGRFGYILAYPLGLCEKCFAGQLALWLYLWKNAAGYSADSAIEHAVFISLTIFITHYISKTATKW